MGTGSPKTRGRARARLCARRQRIHPVLTSGLKENFWKEYSDADAEKEYRKRNQDSDVRDVMGTLMELEKYLPKAGAALLSVFFPGNVDYEPNSLHTSREKKFWMYAKTAASKRKQ